MSSDKTTLKLSDLEVFENSVLKQDIAKSADTTQYKIKEHRSVDENYYSVAISNDDSHISMGTLDGLESLQLTICDRDSENITITIVDDVDYEQALGQWGETSGEFIPEKSVRI